MTALNESDRRHIEYLEKRRPEREKIVEANELARDLRGLVVFLDDEVAKSVMQALDRDGPWQALKVIPVDALSDAREQRKAARAEMANVELRTPSTNGTGEHDWVRDEPGSEPGNTRTVVDLDFLGIAPINWQALWANESETEEEWCIEPILPFGRQAGVFAAAGTGKSLLAADIAAAKAAGYQVLGSPAREPANVVYLDFEMTPDDLRERLTEMGYGPDDDLSRLHYYQLPTLPPLDSMPGGDVLMALVDRHKPELVIIDTMARVVAGDENSADTYRDFYRCSGMRLKAAGVALLRLDHAGKDPNKGQRGSSSKNDDLDVVWSLKANDDQIVLSRTKTRLGHLEAQVVLQRKIEPLSHVLAPATWPAGTREVVDLLDLLDVSLDATCAIAQTALSKNGTGKRKAAVLYALKYRKQRDGGSRVLGTVSATDREPLKEPA